MTRPSWDEYFMKIAHLVAERSTCLRRVVGAIIVKDKRIISTGYNGSPRGLDHCLEIGCMRERLGIPSGERHELCRGAHAEQNAIIQEHGGGDDVLYDGALLHLFEDDHQRRHYEACTRQRLSGSTRQGVDRGSRDRNGLHDSRSSGTKELNVKGG